MDNLFSNDTERCKTKIQAARILSHYMRRLRWPDATNDEQINLCIILIYYKKMLALNLSYLTALTITGQANRYSSWKSAGSDTASLLLLIFEKLESDINY